MIKTLVKIKNKQYEFSDYFLNKLEKLLEKNNGKNLEITFNVIDKIEYCMHKYYRGYLLPDIVDAMGETDQEYVHNDLKKKYLLYKCHMKDILEHHRPNIRVIIDEENNFRGYIPSMAVLTKEEGKEYIRKCENFLFIDLNGCINPKHQLEAKKYRDCLMTGGI